MWSQMTDGLKWEVEIVVNDFYKKSVLLKWSHIAVWSIIADVLNDKFHCIYIYILCMYHDKLLLLLTITKELHNDGIGLPEI